MTENLRIDLEKSLTALKRKLLQIMPDSGDYTTNIENFVLHRYSSGHGPKPIIYQPMLIVVVQGKKLVRIGSDDLQYGENNCFVAGVDMPASSCVMVASEAVPYLSMGLTLDKSLIASLSAEVPPSTKYGGSVSRGAMVQEIGPELLDAFLRLLELTEKPEPEPVLESLLRQEIHYRLLTSPFGNQLRHLNTMGSQSHQITRAIAWLKDNFKEPLHVDELAGRLNMASSTFHKHFKDITTLSPLQYQKHLRLSEAQRLMLSKDYDVTQAAFAVGYESPTQFSREYKRLFGDSPRRDVTRVRQAAA